ncbi:lanthionine synthetase LanC family protein [Parachryseolinea silvisoli]|uniref:lanthionine synthetase LanC family protein n=1 Tax=Parachryseolinea silvisoli TaxID=2873601 RepID=UPI002265EFBD|nr:lanthionine synthetase LanC family protein [Parachryseolinea silvisoli]MCD9015440.1 protein kinase [Parachryseolinea silvisoli]
MKYKEIGNYYIVGAPKIVKDWLLHVSAIKDQLENLFKTIIPELLKHKVSFEIVRDASLAEKILNGSFGVERSGKILTVYPEGNEQAELLAGRLIELTTDFRSPAIPTGSHLGGTVYASHYTSNAGNTAATRFVVPAGTTWPFNQFAQPQQPESRFLVDKYFVQKVIKHDTKGRVMKAIRAKGLSLKRCIIKEGLHDMYFDAFGRDIKTRIDWQCTLLERFEKKLPTPKLYERFEVNGNIYMAMEFIDGEPLHEVFDRIQSNQSWPNLSNANKLALLDCVVQVLGIVKKMHSLGYIHRDISPANFLMRNGKLVMIDLEFAYDYYNNEPSPPFESGLNGFTAPERAGDEKPEFAEDIYSIGAVLVAAFTNFYPIVGFGESHQQTKQSLRCQIQNSELADLISSCLIADAQNRPTIDHLVDYFENFILSVKANKGNDYRQGGNGMQDLSVTIDFGIAALKTPLLAQAGGLWHSAEALPPDASYRKAGLNVLPGLHTGVSGIIYFLSAAKDAGKTLSHLRSEIAENLKHIIAMAKQNDGVSGLYYGKHGIALSIATAIRSGLIQPGEAKNVIKRFLAPNPTDASLATGAAGQGLAILHCIQAIQDDTLTKWLDQLVNYLLQSQLRSGEWKTGNEVFTGFSNGVAGIIVFLLQYHSFYPRTEVADAAARGLSWLTKQAKRKSGLPIWYVGSRTRNVEPWFENGFTGIALAFIEGYKVLKAERYLKMAESILANHPAHLATNDLTFGSGISGIAEVYLELAHISQRDEWHQRANWLAMLLEYNKYTYNKRATYWPMDARRPITGDFFTGCTGVIHFLIRIQNADQIPFPFLLNKPI